MSDQSKLPSVQERAEIEKRLAKIAARVAEILATNPASRESGELTNLLAERLELRKRMPKSRFIYWPK